MRANREVKTVSTEPIDIEVIGGATVTQQSKVAEARPFKFKKGVESTSQKVVTEVRQRAKPKILIYL